jgi:hypothetical protein
MANKPIKEYRATRNAKVAVWDNGDKGFSITISKPSYKNDEGVYVDSAFWTSDLPSIMHALDRALRFCDDNDVKTKE